MERNQRFLIIIISLKTPFQAQEKFSWKEPKDAGREPFSVNLSNNNSYGWAQGGSMIIYLNTSTLSPDIIYDWGGTRT